MDVLCASCALPVYFPPVPLDGRRCGDGGLRGVLPLEAAARAGAGSRSSRWTWGPGFDMPRRRRRPPAPPVVRAHDEAVGTLMAAAHRGPARALARGRRRGRRWLYVRPRVERNATFQVERMREYAEDGYRATRDALTAGRAHLTPTPFRAN